MNKSLCMVAAAGCMLFCWVPLSAQDAASEAESVTASSTQPAEESPSAAASEPFNLLTAKRMTGDWFGLRTDLEDIGFTFSPRLYTNYQGNFSGGENTAGAHEIPGRFDYNFELDLNKMVKLPGATFFFRLRQQWENSIVDDVGSDSEPYPPFGDNFYGDPNCIIVHKWHYRQRLFDDRLEIRLGKIDATDYIDTNEYANSSFTQFSNTFLENAPNVPGERGLGAVVTIWPTDWLYFVAMAVDPDNVDTKTGFDTAFHGPAHFVASWELGLLPAELFKGAGTLPGHYRVGWWMRPGESEIFKDTLDGMLPSESRWNDVGFYFNMDQVLWKENDKPDDTQGLAGFMRYSYAHGDVNRYSHFWSLGLVYQGLIPTRDNDLLALGFAQAVTSSQYRDAIDALADCESVYEMYYEIEVTPWFKIAPDIQVITNPGGRSDARDAFVGGLRVNVIF